MDQFHYNRLQDHNQNIFVMYRSTHGNLLVIDSSPDASTSITQHLINLGYTVTCVENGHKALELLPQKFEMVLLALPLQDRSAEEFIRGMKADNALRGIPVIILTNTEGLEEAERCIKSGAEDYIVLPFRPVVLKSRVSANLERQRVRTAEQTLKDKIKSERDVQIGQQIQLSFLTEKLPQLPGWEIAARFEPAHEVSGDFYDSFLLSNNHISLILGDVSDKGITAALFMALFRSLLRAYTQQDYSAQWRSHSNGDAAGGLNSPKQLTVETEDRLALLNTIELTNNYILKNHNAANMFATIFYGILDPESGLLVYINAGHEPPLVLNQGGVKARLKPTGLAVGMALNVRYEIGQTQLDPGDMLLIYADGISDARNPAGQSFGRDGLFELLKETDLPADALLGRIETNLRTHIAAATLDDDITMLAVKRLA